MERIDTIERREPNKTPFPNVFRDFLMAISLTLTPDLFCHQTCYHLSFYLHVHVLTAIPCQLTPFSFSQVVRGCWSWFLGWFWGLKSFFLPGLPRCVGLKRYHSASNFYLPCFFDCLVFPSLFSLFFLLIPTFAPAFLALPVFGELDERMLWLTFHFNNTNNPLFVFGLLADVHDGRPFLFSSWMMRMSETMQWLR